MEFRDAVAFAPIVGLALVLRLVVAGTVLAAQYLANPVFGSTADYISLGFTAFGSAQVAAILALLITMRGPKQWTGA